LAQATRLKAWFFPIRVGFGGTCSEFSGTEGGPEQMPDSFQDCADSLPWVYSVDWSSSAFEVHGQLPKGTAREPKVPAWCRPKALLGTPQGRSPLSVEEENNPALADERQSLEARIRDSVMAEIREAVRSASKEATEELRAAAAEIRRLRTTVTTCSDGMAKTTPSAGPAGLEVVTDLRLMVEEIRKMLHIQGSNNAVIEATGSRDPLTLTIDNQQLPDSTDAETSDDGDAALAPPRSCIPGRKLRRKSDGSRHCTMQHSTGSDEPRSRQAAASSSTAGGSSSSPSAAVMHRSNSCSRELCLPTDLPDSNNKRAPMQKTVKTKSPRVRDVVSRLERQLEKCNSPGSSRTLLPHPPRSVPVRRVRPSGQSCTDDSPSGMSTPRKSDSFTLLHPS